MTEARFRSMEESMEAIQNRVDQLTQQMTQQLGNSNLLEASHQQVHREVQELGRQLNADIDAIRNTARPIGNPNHADKNLVPEAYALDKALWTSWALRFKRYMDRRHPGLKTKMESVESMASPMTTEQIARLEVDTTTDNDVIDYLLAKTSGEAAIIVQGAQNENSMEIWRRLAHASDPAGTYTELRDTRRVTKPTRCTKMSELATHLATWEDRLRRVTLRT